MAIIEQKNLIGKYLPSIRIQRVKIEDGDSSIKTTLSLVAKEKFDYKSPQGTWSRNPEMLTQAKIKIVQSINPAATKAIINKNFDIFKNVDQKGLPLT